MENQEKNQIKDEYLQGATIDSLIKKYHHEYNTIAKILDEFGIEHHKKAKRYQTNLKNRKQLTQTQIDIIIDAYVNKKYGLLKSGELVGISNIDIVKRTLKENGITIRSFSEAAKLSNQNRALKKNDAYFSVQSPNMAWLLGFLASDGSIGLKDNTISIGLSKKDEEILFRIKEEVEIEKSVKYYTTRDGFDCADLSWTSEQQKKDLSKYGVIPQKTFKLEPPYALDRKYWIDYIRGYFDGDGSVNLIKNNNGRGNGNLRWQICSATPEILSFIVDFLYEEYQIPKVNILKSEKNRKTPLYYFQYSSKSTRLIYKILYTENSLYLKRKKDKFEEILKLVTPLNEIKTHETTLL